MTQKLIDGLRTAAQWIDSDSSKYYWSNISTCQCGLLAQAITGYSQQEIDDYFTEASSLQEYKKLGIWEDLTTILNIEQVCLSTNTPMSSIIKTLLDVGMKPKDFYNLENLADRKTGKLDLDIDFTEAKNASIYMKEWADELEKELTIDE